MEKNKEDQTDKIEENVLAQKKEIIEMEYEKVQQLLSSNIEDVNQQMILSNLKENLDQISFNDKFKVANILLDKYTLAELQGFKEMAIDGINDQERERILDEIYHRFSLEEIQTLLGIGEKYMNSFLAYP